MFCLCIALLTVNSLISHFTLFFSYQWQARNLGSYVKIRTHAGVIFHLECRHKVTHTTDHPTHTSATAGMGKYVSSSYFSITPEVGDFPCCTSLTPTLQNVLPMGESIEVGKGNKWMTRRNKVDHRQCEHHLEKCAGNITAYGFSFRE